MPKSITIRSKNEVRQGRRLGIDFHAMLVNFGFQNGVQHLFKNYLKTDPKKGIQRMPSWCHPWGVRRWPRHGEGRILGPPN